MFCLVLLTLGLCIPCLLFWQREEEATLVITLPYVVCFMPLMKHRQFEVCWRILLMFLVTLVLQNVAHHQAHSCCPLNYVSTVRWQVEALHYLLACLRRQHGRG